MIVTPSNNVVIQLRSSIICNIYSPKGTEVCNVELNSQAYITPCIIALKGEHLKMISVEPLITNTLDEVSVLGMLTELLHWSIN